MAPLTLARGFETRLVPGVTTAFRKASRVEDTNKWCLSVSSDVFGSDRKVLRQFEKCEELLLATTPCCTLGAKATCILRILFTQRYTTLTKHSSLHYTQ